MKYLPTPRLALTLLGVLLGAVGIFAPVPRGLDIAGDNPLLFAGVASIAASYYAVGLTMGVAIAIVGGAVCIMLGRINVALLPLAVLAMFLGAILVNRRALKENSVG